MEYRLVYDLTYQTMSFISLIPLIPLFIISAYLWGVIRWMKAKPKQDFYDKQMLTTPVLLWFLALYASISFGIPDIQNQLKTRNMYFNHEYYVVEGEIENFVPMPVGGHAHESFTVKGIEFEYSDFDLSYHGFRNTSSHGGPITKNGQQVKLAYITDTGKNIILRIEMRP